MSEPKNILDLYESAFPMLGIKYSGNYLSNKMGRLLKVNDHKLVMPHKKYLNTKKLREKKAFVFHPANSNILLEPSLVAKLLCTTLSSHANRVVSGLLSAYVLMISDDVALQELKGTKQMIFNKAPTVSVTESNKLSKFLKSLPHSSVVKVSLAKDRVIDGDNYTCVAKVNFPLYDKLVRALDTSNGTHKFGKTSLTHKYIVDLKECFEVIFPDIAVKDKYSGAGDVSGSPSWVAITSAALKIFSCTNKYKDSLTYSLINLMYFKEDISRDPKAIGLMASKIPPQKGNIGGEIVPRGNQSRRDEPPKKKVSSNKVVGEISDVPWEQSAPVVKPTKIKKEKKKKSKKRKEKNKSRDRRDRDRDRDYDRYDEPRRKEKKKIYRDRNGYVISREEYERVNNKRDREDRRDRDDRRSRDNRRRREEDRRRDNRRRREEREDRDDRRRDDRRRDRRDRYDDRRRDNRRDDRRRDDRDYDRRDRYDDRRRDDRRDDRGRRIPRNDESNYAREQAEGRRRYQEELEEQRYGRGRGGRGNSRGRGRSRSNNSYLG